MNSVKISGTLTRDADVRYTPAGQAVVNFRLLIEEENSKNKNNFIPVIAYGRIVEECRQYLKKGNKIFVEGNLQSREYNTVEGEHRVVLEVVAKKIEEEKWKTEKTEETEKTEGTEETDSTVRKNLSREKWGGL